MLLALLVLATPIQEAALAIRTTIMEKVRTMVDVETGITKDATIKAVTKTTATTATTIPGKTTRLLEVCLLVSYMVVLLFHFHLLTALLL